MSVNKRSSSVYHNINTFKQQWQQVYFSVRNVGSILLNIFLEVVYYHCGKSKMNVFIRFIRASPSPLRRLITNLTTTKALLMNINLFVLTLLSNLPERPS